MKLFKWSMVALLALTTVLVSSCSDDEQVDNRDHNYGFVQFKFCKADVTRSLEQTLDYLSEATRAQVLLIYEGTTIAQSLTLQASSAEAAEWGLRSDKLKLLTGNYQVASFTLYDVNDAPIYQAAPAEETFVEVVQGGLTVQELAVQVTPRGRATFTLVKDFSSFTRAATREYTFDEIKFVNLTIEELLNSGSTANPVKLMRLPADFSIHFDEEDDVEDGYRTSSIACDTLLSLPAGNYRVTAYEVLDSKKVLLEASTNFKGVDFLVGDNQTSEVKVPVAMHESDAYIKDYYALYEIWQSLNGETWCYVGEDWPTGANWDFNKDVDLWGDQPGVQLHSNGRVARIDISNFAFSGHLSPAIGQLTELTELYLGTHNDSNTLPNDPSLAKGQSLEARRVNRLENHKAYLRMIHPATPATEPFARALAEHNITIPATAAYATKREAELIDMKSGEARIVKFDTNHGTLGNGLKSIPAEIGNLTKLEYFYVANSELESLPAEMSKLVSCTDFEVYNCPKMTSFPMAIAEMPELISVNISNNKQWSAAEIYKGLDAIANGPSREKIQILYARENSLEELPASMKQMKKIGLLDLAQNRISKLNPLTKEVAPIQLYLDNNLIEEFPVDENGIFCAYADVETFSARFNRLKLFPNIFSSKSNYTITSIDFAANDIRGCEGEEDGSFKGVNVETLTLAQNYNMKHYPKAFAESNSLISYIILRGCGLEDIPAGSFTYERSINLVSIDLSYNNLTDLPREFHAGNMPYLYGVELSFNSFSQFPYEPLDAAGLTVLGMRSQRDSKGARCLRQWPTGIYQHVGLRGLYLGSNDLREVDDTISTLCYYLDISDNPNIVFDASDICYAWQAGAYILLYDKSQNIKNCDAMLE